MDRLFGDEPGVALRQLRHELWDGIAMCGIRNPRLSWGLLTYRVYRVKVYRRVARSETL